MDTHICFAPPETAHASCEDRHQSRRDDSLNWANEYDEDRPFKDFADYITVKEERLANAREAFEQAKEASQLPLKDGEWNKAVRW